MSLFSSLQVGKNALLVAQLGLQVTSNNIANANTPGYLRQELIQVPAPSQRKGSLLIGLGVEVERIQQKVDAFLEERLRSATSDMTSSQAQEYAWLQLETILGELGENDLSTSLTDFFNAVNDVLNEPESRAVRNLAVLQGSVLSQGIQQLYQRIRTVRNDVDDRVAGLAGEINSKLRDIASLNVQIVTAEGGGAGKSDAVGLRDRRQVLLGELAKITDIRVAEQESGAVAVYSGGEYLVFDGTFRSVRMERVESGGVSAAEIRIAETDAPLRSSSGELSGLITARDEILGGFLEQLDTFSETLIFEFNKVYSRGQGLVGYSTLQSEHAVSAVDAPLDQAGLPFVPASGRFQVQVRNKQTGLTSTEDISVNLNGLDSDTTLEQLAAQLDAVDGVQATISATRKLALTAEGSHLEFALAGDTSGVLAALGINTFFSGSGATNIAVAGDVRAEPGKFAASRDGIAHDTQNAVALASLFETPLESQNGATLSSLYHQATAQVAQGSAVTRSVAEGFRTFQKSLEGEQLAVSGVSLDEEATRMMAYQRVYQMSAKFIASVSDLLDSLLAL